MTIAIRYKENDEWKVMLFTDKKEADRFDAELWLRRSIWGDVGQITRKILDKP